MPKFKIVFLDSLPSPRSTLQKKKMAQQRPTTLSIDEQLSQMFNEGLNTELNTESPELSTSYPNTPGPISATQSTMATMASLSVTSVSSLVDQDNDNDSQTSTIQEEYQVRTLGNHNIARLSILPIYPPFVVSPTTTAARPMATSSRTPHLLLSNVPIESLTEEQYARVRYHAYPQLFKLEMDIGVKINPEKNEISSCESFLLCFYQNLYVKTKKRLKVDIAIIDFSLTRLRHCIGKVVAQRGRQQQTMLDMDELPVALEFYLQFDVDMFFLKTCSFNGVQPRLFDNRFREGLFCIDTPEARFAITPCHQRRCLCCHSPCPRRSESDEQQQQPTSAIPFSIPHIHRFVNQYEAILNCPATCETNNCIYVLTCPCGQFDFVGQSKVSFAETLTIHREEGNRIIREFLIGAVNIYRITHGLKSDEKKANDHLWLYQHSPRCSVALQLFLDYNPDYWCFVPMKLLEVNMANTTSATTSRHSSPRRTDETSFPSPTLSSRSSRLSTSRTRPNEQVHGLVEHVPKPPMGFDFSIDQRQQQAQFFKLLKDRVVPPDNVDVYNADIVAILPDHSSKLFGQLIESLFITHAECKLNEIGHLVYENVDPNRALHGSWCANLTRRPLP